MGWSDPQSREKLRELVARVLEEVEEHGPLAVERACSDHPELADALKQRIESLRRVGLLDRGGSKGDEPIPERLGEFRLLRKLGGGGMGVVYLAEQESLKRRVALKLVRPELLYFSGARERFRREVEVIAKLNHPGIVPIYSVDADADVPWFAMECVEGASLGDVLAALQGKDPTRLGGEDLASALAVAMAPQCEGLGIRPTARFDDPKGTWVEFCMRFIHQAAVALQHAHERGVVHRDVKPNNLMLTPDGRVRLVDFGLASSDGMTELTKSSSQLGSLPYTSPEQLARGITAVDARSDIYALGCVLYELLTLAPAYLDEEPEQTRHRILHGQSAPIRSLHPTVTWDAETVCLTAMERDPARRYATAADFARDLKRVLDFEPIAARRASAALRLKRFAQRRPAVAVGSVLGALLLLGGPTIWAVLERRHRDRLKEANVALAKSNDDLEAANQQILTSNADLEVANRRIEEQLVEEKAARAAATRSADRARLAIVEFLGKVGDEMLANVPGAAELRRDLLQRATEQFEALLPDVGDDTVTLLQMANAFRLLGMRHAELGEPAKARAALQRGIDLTDQIAADSPSFLESKRKRADLLSDRAMIAIERESEPVAALADVDVAIDLYRELLDRDEFTESVRTALGHALGIRGQALATLGRFDEAVPTFEQSIRVLTEAVQRKQGVAQASANLLAARNNLAGALERADRLEESEQMYATLLADVLPELERAPHDSWRRLVAAAARGNRAKTLARLERQEEAEPLFREAIVAYEALAKDFPQLPIYRCEVARNCLDLAEALETIHGSEDEEIGPLLERARPLLEPLAPLGPSGDRLSQAALVKCLRRLGERNVRGADPRAGLAQLARAATLAADLVARDEGDVDLRRLAASVQRVYAGVPEEVLSRPQRTEHACRAVDLAADAVRLAQPSSDQYVREELLDSFDALAALAASDDDARKHATAAASRLLELLPGDPAAASRASRANRFNRPPQ